MANGHAANSQASGLGLRIGVVPTGTLRNHFASTDVIRLPCSVRTLRLVGASPAHSHGHGSRLGTSTRAFVFSF